VQRRQLWANIVIPASLPVIAPECGSRLGQRTDRMVRADLYTALSGLG